MVYPPARGLANPYAVQAVTLPDRVRPRSGAVSRVLAVGAATVGLGLAGGAVASAAPDDGSPPAPGGVTVVPAGSPTPLGAEVLNGPDVDVPSAQRFLTALLLEGAISPELYQQFSGDPAFLSGVGSILGSGGTVRWDSPAQAEMDRLLAASQGQMQAVLSEPFDPLQGPSGAQLLTLHALSGGNDFAFLEVLLHYLRVKHPDLELRADYGPPAQDNRDQRELTRFGFVRAGVPVSSPFLDTIVGRFDPRDLTTPTGPNEEGALSFDMAPTFEHVNGTRFAGADPCQGAGDPTVRGCLIRDIVGVAVRPDRVETPTLTVLDGSFDVDDNYVTGSTTPGSETEIVRFLRLQAPELLEGRAYLSIKDRTTLLGGLGDDYFGVVGGDVTVAGGGGDNTTAVAGTGSVTVVDAPGGTEEVTTVPADGGRVRIADPTTGRHRVVDVPSSGEIAGVEPTGAADLTLTSPTGPCGLDGVTVARLGTDGQLDAHLSSCDTTSIGVLPDATVEVGQIDASGPGQQTLGVAGVATGADGGGDIDLGAGDDRVETRPDSAVADVAIATGGGDDVAALGGVSLEAPVDLGSGDDALAAAPESMMIYSSVTGGDGDDEFRLAGHSEGSPVELGEGNDLVVLHDTATGEYFFADPEESWCYARECPKEGRDPESVEVHEHDELFLGESFTPVDYDDDDVDVSEGFRRLDPVTGQPVAFVDGSLQNIEQVGHVQPDGTVTALQYIPPEVVQQASFLKVLSDVARVGAVIATGPVGAGLGIGSVALEAGHGLVNGADPLTTAIASGASIAGEIPGVPSWIPPAGALTASAINEDVPGMLVNGLATAGLATQNAGLYRASVAAAGAHTLATSLEQGDPLGALDGAGKIATAFPGLPPELRLANATVDVARAVQGGNVADIIIGGIGLADAAEPVFRAESGADGRPTVLTLSDGRQVPVQVLPDGTVVFPDGGRMLPDGTVVLPDGTPVPPSVR